LQIVDIESAQIKSLGRFYRWLTALLFAFLFVGWSWIWGRVAKHEERQLLFAASEGETSSEIHALDVAESSNESNSNGVLNSEETSLEIVEATIVGHANLGGFDRKNIIWNMMTVGGIFAIVWSVIPMFFFGADGFNELFYPLYYFRLVVAVFVLVVGLLATCRGIGRYENWMNGGVDPAKQEQSLKVDDVIQTRLKRINSSFERKLDLGAPPDNWKNRNQQKSSHWEFNAFGEVNWLLSDHLASKSYYSPRQ
jgi:hypothetical protein